MIFNINNYIAESADNKQYGVPEEKKFPLDSEAHVRSAVKFFNYVKPEYEEELASNIKKKIKEYDLDISIGDKNRLKKYIKESYIIENTDKFEFIDLNTDEAKKYLEGEKYWEKFKDYHINNSKGEIVIDKEKDCLAGYIFINDSRSDSEGFITPLEVVKKYRNQGLGTKLLKDAINKYNAIDLVVKKNNKNAYNLYLKNGFVVIGDGNEKNDIWMKLKSKLDKHDKIVKESVNLDKEEMALNAINPIVGTNTCKPYVAVASSGGILDTKRYGLSSDLVSDKYLVIDEDKNKESYHLEMTDASFLANGQFEVYEYVGNRSDKIAQIYQAYKENKSLYDPNFIYTCLSGKKLLSEDQIEFDTNFKKVNLEQYKDKIESIEYTMINGDNDISFPVLEGYNGLNINPELKKYDYISFREDMNGYYAIDTLTNNRTKSVKDINDITESMIISLR